jgi:hypothetical protein
MPNSPYARETTETLLEFVKAFVKWVNSADSNICPSCGKAKTDTSHRVGEGCLVMNATNMIHETELEGQGTPLRDDMLKFSKQLAEWAYLIKDGQSEIDKAAREAMRPMLRGLLKSLDRDAASDAAIPETETSHVQ